MQTEEYLKGQIKKNPRDPMTYYYLGKELMGKPLKSIESLTFIEKLFKQSINLGPHLWAPKIMLGELLYKMGRLKEAEPYFKETLKAGLRDSSSVREYLTKCLSQSSQPGGNHQVSKRDSYIYLKIMLESLLEIYWKRVMGLIGGGREFHKKLGPSVLREEKRD